MRVVVPGHQTKTSLQNPHRIQLHNKNQSWLSWYRSPHYIQSNQLNNEDYLFKSTKTDKPITRQQAYRIIHQAAEAIGIEGKIGTNSMRKTFGFHAYKRGIAISLLQKHFNHSTPSETLRYLGISKDEKIRTEIDVNL